MAEWFKAPVLKTGVGASPPWVRIPPHPPIGRLNILFYKNNIRTACAASHILTHILFGSTTDGIGLFGTLKMCSTCGNSAERKRAVIALDKPQHLFKQCSLSVHVQSLLNDPKPRRAVASRTHGCGCGGKSHFGMCHSHLNQMEPLFCLILAPCRFI